MVEQEKIVVRESKGMKCRIQINSIRFTVKSIFKEVPPEHPLHTSPEHLYKGRGNKSHA